MIWDFLDLYAKRLLAWAILCLLAGIVLAFSNANFQIGVGVPCCAWGLVLGFIALWGRRGLNLKKQAPFDHHEADRRTARFRKMLVLNIGVDGLCFLGGVIWNRILGLNDLFQSGMGWGIILQSGFLACFDLLHFLWIPSEIKLPDWRLFEGPEHATFRIEAGRPAILLIHGFPDTPYAVRELADRFIAQGWSVTGLLLPGFGAQMTGLFQCRTVDWISAIVEEIVRLKREHYPVLLVGFSFGGGLSIPAAVRANPDALLLLAPFWLRLNTLQLALYQLIRLFAPLSFRIAPFFNLAARDARDGVDEIAPGISFDDPRLPAVIHSLPVSFLMIEQFLSQGEAVWQNARRWRGPTLIIQGANDPLARPTATRRLVSRLGLRPAYLEVPGGHNLNLPSHPSFEKVVSELITFADQQKKTVF